MMRLELCWLVLLALLGYAVGDSAECREKQDGCYERVQVNVSTFVQGLIDDVPKEVIDTFVEASAGCLKCVDPSDLLPLTTGNNGCPAWHCAKCGDEWLETWLTCRDCCGECRCMGCHPDKWWGMCEDCCEEDDTRRLSGAVSSSAAGSGMSVDFTIDVCMDDVSPLDPSSTYYVDFESMIEDFTAELAACYADKDEFSDRWASLAADSGIDLSTMARSDTGGTIMFEMEGVDKDHAKVTTYSSDESHRSTSHMIFYGALGFVSVSAFAVMGTAVVVKVLNKRKELKREQTAKWVSEMTNADVANPVMDGGA